MTQPATRDQFLQAVGQVTHAAAMTDLFVYLCFQQIVPAPPKVTAAIYYTLDSMHAKGTMLMRVAGEVCERDEKAELRAAIEAAKDAHGIRQKIAHSMVAVDEKGAAYEVNFRRPPSAPGPMPLSRLQQLVADIEEEVARARTAHVQFTQLWGARTKGRPPSPIA